MITVLACDGFNIFGMVQLYALLSAIGIFIVAWHEGREDGK